MSTRQPHSRYHDLIVLLIGATVTLWLVAAGLYLDRDNEPVGGSSGEPPTSDSDRANAAQLPSRSDTRTTPAIPPAGLVAAPSSPEPDRDTTGVDASPTVAPEGKQGPGSGEHPWPWDELANCESGGDWHINTGNGYYGGLQFSLSTWQSVGGAGYPHEATPAEQLHRGRILRARSGWGQWPHCAVELGLLP